MSSDVSPATTEQRLEANRDLDLWSTARLVELINDEDAKVAPAVRGAAVELALAIDDIAARVATGGRLVYVGAGTSGRLAVLDAAEVPPTFGVGTDRVVAVIARGAAATAIAQEAAEDDAVQGDADLASVGVDARDAVVLLSASGTTPYVLGAAAAAADAGALTVAVTCVEATPLARLTRHEVVAEVGPEVIAGSTRMKAGTAQKLVLNTISTVTMIRLGRTFGNLMVDVVASNAKLRKRSRRAARRSRPSRRRLRSRAAKARAGR